jgi:hypothetical protein
MSVKEEKDDDFRACYNCCGTQMRYECGMPEVGCELCSVYGDSQGRLLKRYRDQSVVMDGYKYTPPPWTCLWCHDTKMSTRKIWVKRIVDYGCSDMGIYMPEARVPCFACGDKQASDAAFVAAQAKWTRFYAMFPTDAAALIHAIQVNRAKGMEVPDMVVLWKPCTRVSTSAPASAAFAAPAQAPPPPVSLHAAVWNALRDMARGFTRVVSPQ